MDTHQIDKILKRNRMTARYYLGCFPSDEILKINFKKLPFPQSLVVNFDPSNLKGSHWVAIFADSSKSVDYYDSLGIWPPINHDITEYLSKFDRVHINPYAFQSSRSNKCGKHAIFFIYNRSAGKSFNQILHFFTKNNNLPDRVVANFVSKEIFNSH